REDAAIDRQQVRREDQRAPARSHTQSLRDFGPMAVFEDVVGFETLADLDEVSVGGRRLPRPGHAGFRIADDRLPFRAVLSRTIWDSDQTGAEPRDHRRDARGRI